MSGTSAGARKGWETRRKGRTQIERRPGEVTPRITVHAHTYHDQAGYSITGKDHLNRSVKIFVRTKREAEQIRNRIKNYQSAFPEPRYVSGRLDAKENAALTKAQDRLVSVAEKHQRGKATDKQLRAAFLARNKASEALRIRRKELHISNPEEY